MTPEPITSSQAVTETILVVNMSPQTFNTISRAIALATQGNVSLRATEDMEMGEILDSVKAAPVDAVLLSAGEFGKTFDAETVRRLREAADRPVLVIAFNDEAYAAAMGAGLETATVLSADPLSLGDLPRRITTAIRWSREQAFLERARKLIEANYAALRKISHDVNNSIGVMWLNLHSLKRQCEKTNTTDLSMYIESLERETRTIAALAGKVSALRDEQKLA